MSTPASACASVLASVAGATEGTSSSHTRLATSSPSAALPVPDPAIRTEPPASATASARALRQLAVADYHDGQDLDVGWKGHSDTAARWPSTTAACARRGVTQSPARCTSNGTPCSSCHSSSSGA